MKRTTTRLTFALAVCTLLFLAPSRLSAQLFDDFTDSNYTVNPVWDGDTAKFKVNGTFELQTKDTAASEGSLSTSQSLASLNNIQWTFYVHLGFSPSANNYARVYLTSDSPDLKAPLNGYYLQFGEALGNDAVELFSQAGATSTSVCRGTNGHIANPFYLGVKVTRDSTGFWQLAIDTLGGTNYMLEATGIDLTYTSSEWFGVYARYTVSNATSFWFDNFNIHNMGCNLTATSTQANVLCFGGNNGTATIVDSAGTPPFTYLWSPGGQTTATAVGLSAGTYTGIITDTNLCTATVSVTITEPTALADTIITTDACFGGANGTAIVQVTGGTPPYSYLWNAGGQTTDTITNLSPGTYIVAITDPNGCILIDTTFVAQAPEILLTANHTNTTTCGGNDGTTWVDATGGTAPYSYLWTPGGQTTDTASNLSEGIYTITVTDSNGCTATTTDTVSGPYAIIATVAVSNILCNGDSNGVAIATVTGGITPLTYSWSPSGGSADTASNLMAGSYTVTITDSGGCSTSASAVITEPAAISLAVSHTDESCSHANGTATAIASGGISPLTYLWSPSGDTTNFSSNLSAGIYTVTVTDSNGCVATASDSVSNTGTFVVTLSSQNVSCFGDSNGVAMVINLIGGLAPYTYSWSPSGGNSDTAFNLSAGTYTVVITDSTGCIATDSVVISEPAAIALSISHTDETCGSGNGTANVVATGGTAPYTYLWSPSGGTSAVDSNLSAGAYTVTVTDSSACTSSATDTVNNSGTITATLTSSNLLCNGDSSGMATVTVASGTAPYTYSWSPSGGSSDTASNLAAGTYIVTVNDSGGCSFTDSVIITEPIAIGLFSTHNNEFCNQGNGIASTYPVGGTAPFTYLWSPTGSTTRVDSNLSAGTYIITATDASGCSSADTLNVYNVGTFWATVIASNVKCFGDDNGIATVNYLSGGVAPFTYDWSPSGGSGDSAINLSPGTYTVIVTDSAGCSYTNSATVSEPAVITLATYHRNEYCSNNNGIATVFVAGGTAPYAYLWSPSGATSQTDSNIAAGTYQVEVTDASGCTADTSVTLNNINGPQANLSIVHVSCAGCCNGNATVNATGGTPPYSYAWSNGDATQSSDSLCVGSYTVVITDANGCTDTETVVVENRVGIDELFSENYFEIIPNPTSGQFTIRDSQFTMKSVEIFNTLGEKVYSEVLNTKHQTLNPKLTAGIYFVRVGDGKKSVVRKLVVE